MTKTNETAKTRTADWGKPALHTFTFKGYTYERRSPRTYTHIILGDENPSWNCEKHRTDCCLGWSQSKVNAEKTAQAMRGRGWVNVNVYEVSREAR